jgi:hypothetical protein
MLDRREERERAILPGEPAEDGAAGVEFAAVFVLPDAAEVSEGDGSRLALLPEHGHTRVDRFPDERVTEDTWIPIYVRFRVASWLTRHARTSPTLSMERFLGLMRPLTDAHHLQ